LAIVGSGPAGLAAALEATNAGAKVLLIDENANVGGQLLKQTHKFFGSSKRYAGIRGIDIGNKMLQELDKNHVEISLTSIVFQIFGKELLILKNEKIQRVKTKKIIYSCGASEKVINFPGWTLPGVMGAGGAQTLVNVHRVSPGNRILMIGSGNVGLVVSYQLIQAGADVVAVIEALPKIGGYGVHASKICRAGVPILTSHKIKEAYGNGKVEAATIVALDKKWQPILNTERTLKVDVICLAVGLKPKIELPLMSGCKTVHSPTLGGRVPIHDENMETTEKGIYVAGDIAGVEEVDTAIEEGRLAGIASAEKLGYISEDKAKDLKIEVRKILGDLRSGPFGEHRERAKKQLIQIGKSSRQRLL